MKFKKIFQKAAAVVMAAVTVFSVLPATTAFAAVGDVGTISFSHTYDGNGNAMRYNSSANITGYIAGGTGDYKYRMFVDGDTAFCLQPGVPLKTGNTLKEASSEAWNALSGSQKKQLGLPCSMGIRETEEICLDQTMRNGLRPRLLYGSLLRDAVKPQAHTARQAAPCTACTLVLIIQTAEQRKSMTRLFR